jgi:hypothetical protein
MDTLNIEKLNRTIDTVLTIVNDISQHTQPKTSNCCDITTVIILIFLTGFIGGLANYLSIKEYKEQTWRNFFNSVLLGFIGASLVPLFLQLTSSKLLENCGLCYTTFLVLSGYMLIASIFSKRLIDNLGKKIFNLEDIKKEIEKAETEPEAKEDLPKNERDELEEKLKTETKKLNETQNLTNEEKDQAIDDTNKLLANMQGSRYKFRTLSGLAKSTQFGENKVFVILSVLKSKNIVEEVTKDGKTYFKLSDRGQSLRLLKHN